MEKKENDNQEKVSKHFHIEITFSNIVPEIITIQNGLDNPGAGILLLLPVIFPENLSNIIVSQSLRKVIWKSMSLS